MIECSFSGQFVEDAYDSALKTLLWSELDDDGDPFDSWTNIDYITGETGELRAQIVDFLNRVESDSEIVPVVRAMGAEDFGYDFILTRNGHGAGFWDRCLGVAGDKLSEMAKSYGSAYLTVDECGNPWLSA